MTKKMVIEEVQPLERGVTVRFFTTKFPSGSRVFVTIYEDPMPTGQALLDYLMRNCPHAWLDAKDVIATAGAPDMSELSAQIGAEHTVPEPVNPLSDII